jgi:uncharacterized protein YbbK (DUF523 family)
LWSTMKIVSACLAGIPCRFDGKAKPCQKIIQLVEEWEAIPVCPEVLWWLSTPREIAERIGEKVMTVSGKDITDSFVLWAKKALKIAQDNTCNEAILKFRSSSCGVGKIYDGNFTHTLIDGDWVFTELLKENGITVITENDL